VYQLPIPTDDPTLLANGLKIMRDWAQEALLDPKEIESERGVILEEERLTKGAKDRMAHKYYPMMLNHSRYALRLPIGIDSILINFKPATIKRFYNDWYRPDLQALIVVGDVDIDAVEKIIKSRFSDLKTPANERPRIAYTIPLDGKNQFMAVTDKEMSGTSLQIMYKHKAAELKTEADYVEMMKRFLFGQMIASRRYQEISRLNNSAFANMGMSIQPLLGGAEAFVFNVEAKEGRLPQAFAQSWSFLEKLKRFGFTQAELDQAKQNYLRSFETSLKEKDKTPSVNFVKEYQNLFLHQLAAPGIEWENTFAKNHIGAIQLTDINGVLKAQLQETNHDILILAPEKDKSSLPDSATVMAWIDAAGKAPLQPFKDEQVTAKLMAVKPVAGKVTEKKLIPEIGVTTLKLSNGVKVILKPTDFKNDQIIFRGFSPGGTSLYNDDEYDNAANAAALVSHFGLANFNPIQLNQVLNGKVMNVSAAIGLRNETINGSSSIADLETALQVAYLQFT
ncbi:MAG TPA: insulinase family protein, partial [Pedobacter sp.]